MHRRILASGFLSLLLLAVTGVVIAEGAAKQPKAVPVEPEKDFSTVPKGDTIVHQFLIRNEGDVPLEITDVHPACGCTVAEYDQQVAPGKAGKINVKLDTSSFTGPISKSVAVFTNDPDNPKIQLVMKAEVQPFITLLPGYARFSYVQGEAVGTIKQTLWAEDGYPIKVLSVKAPYDHLKVSHRPAKEGELHEKAEGKPQWLVDITLDAESPIGALRDYVEVVIDHPKQKTAQIPISGFVRPRQHVTPEQVDFGTLEGAALPLKRVLAFTNFITAGIELTKIETGHFALDASVVETGRKDGHRFKVVLEVLSEMPAGDFSTVVKIHTTDGQNPLIEIPVNGKII